MRNDAIWLIDGDKLQSELLSNCNLLTKKQRPKINRLLNDCSIPLLVQELPPSLKRRLWSELLYEHAKQDIKRIIELSYIKQCDMPEDEAYSKIDMREIAKSIEIVFDFDWEFIEPIVHRYFQFHAKELNYKEEE